MKLLEERGLRFLLRAECLVALANATRVSNREGMRLQAPHCPSCGAPVEVPPGASRVSCAYCQTNLVVEAESVSTRGYHGPPPAKEAKAPPFPEPEATLRNWAVPRFEVSLIEQLVPESVPEVFAGFELPEQRFAFVSMRVADGDGVPQPVSLDAAFAELRESLENDRDPGLAANLALERLCKGAFTHRLEVAIALFDPSRMKVTPYAAGCRDALAWASSEEGRTITISGHHDALERKSLRERGSQFENGRAIQLAASDLVLFPSPAFFGRGTKGYGNGQRALFETANAHLGEEPLRLVTLAKNAFWEDFQKNVWSRPRPGGDVKLVAVRALLPELVATSAPAHQLFKTKQYECAVLPQAGDRLSLVPLEPDRHALVWLSATVTDEEWRQFCDGVVEVLGRKDGDNDNARDAGRRALEALTGAPNATMLVAHLSDRYRRVKWFRQTWKQPVQLGPRGVRTDGSHQAFDEGGEATVEEGSRLFFPGSLDYPGHPQAAEQLAQEWPGGKASRLYEAFERHWKTKRSGPALEQLWRAAVSDQPSSPSGFALITGLP